MIAPEKTDVTWSAAKHLITHCGAMECDGDEEMLVISDSQSSEVASTIVAAANDLGMRLRHEVVPSADTHGSDPPPDIASAMLNADLTIAITQYSLAHSQARLEASKLGKRFLSLPAFTPTLLADPCVRFDFRGQELLVEDVARRLTAAKEIRVTTTRGTDISFDVTGRKGNACPGFVDADHLLGSPPDVEANISPREDSARGLLVVDGSITCPEIGLLHSLVEISLADGRMQSFSCRDENVTQRMHELFNDINPGRRVVGECGLGLNPEAKLTGTMLTDEGSMGSTHFGFGSNYTIGGQHRIDFHLDFVVRDTTVELDGEPLFLRGELVS